ncbi:unnamed protein product, partial [Ectocarpus fasciculatus]
MSQDKMTMNPQRCGALLPSVCTASSTRRFSILFRVTTRTVNFEFWVRAKKKKESLSIVSIVSRGGDRLIDATHTVPRMTFSVLITKKNYCRKKRILKGRPAHQQTIPPASRPTRRPDSSPVATAHHVQSVGGGRTAIGLHKSRPRSLEVLISNKKHRTLGQPLGHGEVAVSAKTGVPCTTAVGRLKTLLVSPPWCACTWFACRQNQIR